MSVFEYTALDGTGGARGGTIEAQSCADARRKLRQGNIYVRDVIAQDNAAEAESPGLTKVEQGGRVKSRQLCQAIRHLSVLLQGGMPLAPALGALVEQLDGEPLGLIIAKVHDRVNSGASFAAALEEYPAVFSPLLVSMVQAGQSSGTLEESLLRMAQMMENRARLNGKIKSALTYPALMAVVALGTVTFLMAFVIPGISQILLDMDRQLPWPTILLIKLSTFIKTYLLLIVAVGGAGTLALSAYVKTAGAKHKWDRLKLRLPLFGKLSLKVETTRLMRTLGTLLGGGMPVMEALTVAIGVIQNSAVAAAMTAAREAIGRGASVAQAVSNTGLFAPVIRHAIATGEMSGDLEKGLISIAQVYDDEIEATARHLTALVEPAILLIMGAIVGFIVLAILLPIFEINQIA